jgi:hypothetical protein
MYGHRRIRRLLLALSMSAVLSFFSFGGGAGAQDATPAPADVSLVVFDESALPAAPPGFVSRREGEVRWDHPPGVDLLVDELAQTLRSEWPRIERELGADVEDGLVIRIGRSHEEMAALAPRGAPPPAYAVGVAYPASGLVLLTLSAPETWERPALRQVLVHELSHVALHRAANGRPVPRWLAEGLAIHQARERSFERVRSLWEATARGQLVPLDDLARAFPTLPHRVNVAYAESADFVEWLSKRSGEPRLPELISRIARDQPFETAVSQTFHAGIGQLEHEWREELAERFGAFPLLLGTGAIWVLIAVLVVLAWIRRRRGARVTLQRWADEEAEQERIEARARALAELRMRAAGTACRADAAPAVAAEDASGEHGDDEEEEDDLRGSPALDLPWRTEERDPHVPTIVWEGRSHTLH